MAKKKQPVGTEKKENAEAAKSARSKDGLRTFFADRQNLYIMLGLAAGCLILYGQTIGFDFVGLDDSGYVFSNPVVARGLSPESIYWSFTTYAQTNWHPLTWISYLIDTSLFGIAPGTYHLTNVLLHTLNSALLFFLLHTLTGAKWRSAIVAAIFAFHPTHVESVAWISERKDVLSTLFWILGTYFYVRFARAENDKTKFYALTVVAMALGILAKPMVVTLPFTLLLLDFWPLGRLEKLTPAAVTRLLVEKIPLFVLSAASSVITVIAQRSGGAVISLEQIPFSIRGANALVAYVKYFLMMFYPVNLGVFYPYDMQIPTWQIAGSAVLLAAITTYCIFRMSSQRYLLVGWLWFLGTMVPVIGLVQVGTQNMADRYTYVPYIGLGIMLVWLAYEWLKNLDRRAPASFAAVVLIAFFALAFLQVRFWQNSETLFTRALAVTGKNGFIEQQLCLLYLNQNRLDEAEPQCRNSIEHEPTYYPGYKMLGVITFKRGNYAEAEKNFAKAYELLPADTNSYSSMMQAIINQGRTDEALRMTEQMAAEKSADPATAEKLAQNYYMLGLYHGQKNETARAAGYFQRALEIKPDHAGAKTSLQAIQAAQNKK